MQFLEYEFRDYSAVLNGNNITLVIKKEPGP